MKQKQKLKKNSSYMQDLHDRLMSKDGWYASWHAHKNHQVFHWVVLSLVIVLVGTLTIGQFKPSSLKSRFGFAGTTVIVNSGDNLQTIVDNATCGSNIIIQAGATFTVGGDYGLMFRNKQCFADPIVLRSSRAAELSGRVNPIDNPDEAQKMFKIVSSAGYSGMSIGSTVSGLNFIGMEITTADRSIYLQMLVDNQGSDITFDRSWIHSLEDGTNNPEASVRMGVSTSGDNLTIKDSRISYFSAYSLGRREVDNNFAVLVGGSANNTLIDNSFLGAWYNNFFSGGSQFGITEGVTVEAGATLSGSNGQATFSNVSNLSVGQLISFMERDCIPGAFSSEHSCDQVSGHEGYWGAARVTAIAGNVVSYTTAGVSGYAPLTIPPISGNQVVWNGVMPRNITLRRSEFWKNPVSAQQVLNETSNSPKGYWEIKAVDGMLVEGNELTGYPSNMAFLVANQGAPSGCYSVWSAIKNITVRSNWYHPDSSYPFAPVGVSMNPDYYCPSAGGRDIVIENNLFNTGSPMIRFSFGSNLTVRHNTAINNGGAGQMVQQEGGTTPGVKFNDNIAINNEYGFHCGERQDLSCVPGLEMERNLIVGAYMPYRPYCGNPYAASNNCVDSIDGIGFVNSAGNDYRLNSNSPFKGTASGGTDPGVNWSQLVDALGFDPAGDSPQPTTVVPSSTPTPTVSPSATPTPSPSATVTPTPSATPTSTTPPSRPPSSPRPTPIVIVDPTPTPEATLSFSPSSLSFQGTVGDAAPASKTATLSNTGSLASAVTLTSSHDWCKVQPGLVASIVPGRGSSTITVSVSKPSNQGQFYCTITAKRSASDPSPTLLTVSYSVGSAAADKTEPITTITSPANKSTVRARSYIAIYADASDNSGLVTKVEFYINGTLQRNCTNTKSSYVCYWIVPAGKNKIYSVESRAYDAAGNVGKSAPVTVKAN